VSRWGAAGIVSLGGVSEATGGEVRPRDVNAFNER